MSSCYLVVTVTGAVAVVLAVVLAVAVTVTVVAGSAGGRVCCGGTWV